LKISFRLNNIETHIDVAPDRRVVDVIREDLGLTGTKESCGSGDCGSCTILVSGESRLSCLMLAAQLHDRDVVTIEGLTEGTHLHVLQESFEEHGAVQCGFCTPGMIMASVNLLKETPQPSRCQIREGLVGNICRCTGYQKIVDAVEYASQKLHCGDDHD
jgi:aerobic carbon-monoxide dehydrogenase small subunit